MLLVKSKVIAASQTLADLTGRCSSLTDADVTGIFAATALILDPYPADATNPNSAIASVTFNGTTPSLAWRKNSGSSGSSLVIDVSATAGMGGDGESVLIATVSYTYSPFFTIIVSGPTTFSETSYIRPRLVTKITDPSTSTKACSW